MCVCEISTGRNVDTANLDLRLPSAYTSLALLEHTSFRLYPW